MNSPKEEGTLYIQKEGHLLYERLSALSKCLHIWITVTKQKTYKSEREEEMGKGFPYLRFARKFHVHHSSKPNQASTFTSKYKKWRYK